MDISFYYQLLDTGILYEKGIKMENDGEQVKGDVLMKKLIFGKVCQSLYQMKKTVLTVRKKYLEILKDCAEGIVFQITRGY